MVKTIRGSVWVSHSVLVAKLVLEFSAYSGMSEPRPCRLVMPHPVDSLRQPTGTGTPKSKNRFIEKRLPGTYSTDTGCTWWWYTPGTR